MQRSAFQLTLFRELESAPRVQQIPLRWDSGSRGGHPLQAESDAPLPERHPLENQPAILVAHVLTHLIHSEYSEPHCSALCGCHRIGFKIVYNAFFFGPPNVAEIEKEFWASPLGKKYQRAECLRLEFLSQLNPKKRPRPTRGLSKEASA